MSAIAALRMRRRGGVHTTLALLLILVTAGAGFAQDAAWRSLGAGDANHAWVVMPVEIVPTGPVRETIRRGQLYHLLLEAPLGTALAMRAHSLLEPPLFIAAHGETLTFIYPPTSSEPPSSVATGAASLNRLPVRFLHMAGAVGNIMYYDPPDRFAIGAALSVEGEVASVAATEPGLAALERVLTNDESPSSLRARRDVIHLLTRDGWAVVPTDSIPADSKIVELVPAGDALGAVVRTRDGEVELWSLRSPRSEWRTSKLPEEALRGGLRALPGGFVRAEYDHDSRTLALRILLGDRAIPLATVSEVDPSYALAPLGENVAVVWMEQGPSSRMRIVIVSGVTGRRLYDDYARFTPPLTPADLRLVAFLLSAVMLGVLLFLLKPENAAFVEAPAGWAPADPVRRLAAGAIDIFLAGFASSLIWKEPIGSAINPSSLIFMSGPESWSVVTTMGIYFVLGTGGEWLFGRSIGKAALRCRVHSTRGDRVRIWQAAARNLVKIVAPPLVAILLIDPARRHPGDLIGGTLIIAPSSDREPDHPDSPSHSGKDE